MRRVLITGLGVIAGVGSGTDAFWRGMQAAAGRPAPARDPHAHMALPLMYSVPDADVPSGPVWLDGRALGLASRLGVEAARQAVEDAGLIGSAPPRTAVVIGTGMGDSGLREEWRVDGAPAAAEWDPVWVVASAVGDWLGVRGANASLSNACAASGYAIAIAADMIRAGDADVVVTGGAEAYSRVALGCFNQLRAVDPVRCRPFDRHRAGTVFGEGAAMLVLEAEEHARQRGAAAYARLAGTGWSCDAYHPTAPEPAGAQIVRAMRAALAEAGATPDAVGCVVPHGTGTELNDVVEGRALQEVLGERCAEVPLQSLKALIGHTGGAAGALATLAAVLIVHRGVVPPNVPLDELDPECAVWVPQGEAVPLTRPSALVNAYAFGGNNVSLYVEAA